MDPIEQAHKAIRQAEKTVRSARPRRDQRMRVRDIDPRITFDFDLGDKEKNRDFEDAFTRKLINEVGDPSLPPVPPRAPRSRTRQPATPPPAPKPEPTGPRPIPRGYEKLIPGDYDEALQYVTLMYPEYSDNPRRQRNEAQQVLQNIRRNNGTWGDQWTPWGARADQFKQWAGWKRQRNRRRR